MTKEGGQWAFVQFGLLTFLARILASGFLDNVSLTFFRVRFERTSNNEQRTSTHHPFISTSRRAFRNRPTAGRYHCAAPRASHENKEQHPSANRHGLPTAMGEEYKETAMSSHSTAA